MLTAANATGQLVFLPMAAWLAAHEGWRVALMPGLGACLLAGLLFWLLGRDRPSDLGLPAYGEPR